MPEFPDRGEIRFRRRRDAGDVLNATVALIRRNARELLTSYLAVVAPVALAGGISAALYFGQVGDIFADPAAMESDPFAVFNATYLGIILFGLLGSAVTTAAAAAYVGLYREGRAGEISASVLWDETKGLILPFVGLTLAVGGGALLSGIINVIPCLGTIAWLAFLIWAMPYVAVTIAARTLEAPTVGAAWRRSRALVKGSWGFAAGALVISVVVFYVFALVLSLPIYVVMGLAGLNSAGDPAGLMQAMGFAFAPLQVLTYAGYLIPLLATFFVHGRLVDDLEGTELYEDLDALADEARVEAGSRSASPATEPKRGESPRDDPPADGGGFRGGGFRS